MHIDNKGEFMRSNRATIVSDFGFGDAGKGSIIDFLARRGRVSAVIRYNGGGQAAHNGVTPDGRHHTFRQFGSGTFVPGVRTFLSRFMLVDPIALVNEAAGLMKCGISRPFERLFVAEDACVVTPFHAVANHLREHLRGEAAHGTCGMGIGETKAYSLAFPKDAVLVEDLRNPWRLKRKLRRLQDCLFADFNPYRGEFGRWTVEEFNTLADSRQVEYWRDRLVELGRLINVCPSNQLQQLAREGNLLFEGAQGVLLDEWYGFHPHTTWSTTTFANALTLLDEIGYTGDIEKLGLLRAYYTRHGAGPFVTEDAELTKLLPDVHNGDSGWQGLFRIGWFDMVMAKYALSVSGGADSLAITNMDRFLSVESRKICTSYRFDESTVTDEEKACLHAVSLDSSSLQAFALRKKQELTDLSYQERLGGLLRKAVPVYKEVVGGAGEYLQTIEEELHLPISIVSHGPTAGDKIVKSKSSR